MDKLDLIYDAVIQHGETAKDIRRELRDHIKDEDEKFAAVQGDIHYLKKESALTKQRVGLFSAGIAAVVAGILSFFANWFGAR